MILVVFAIGVLGASAQRASTSPVYAPETSTPVWLPGDKRAMLLAIVAAFNSGDSARVEALLVENLSPTALAERSAHDRASVLSKTHALIGDLVVRDVQARSQFEAYAVCQSVMTDEWFGITADFDPNPPHRLTTLKIGFSATPEWALPRAALSDRAIAAATEAYASKLTRAGLFSGIIVVATDYGSVYDGAFGNDAGSPGKRHRLGDRFSIASVGKLFTSVAIGQLQERGKLSLSDRIGRWLPDFPNSDARQITIGQLLAHTSGLTDYMDKPDYQSARQKAGGRLRRLTDYLPFFATDRLLFAPGEGEQYSNGGYVVLGLIVEKITHSDFQDYVNDFILKPAAMHDTLVESISPAGGEVSTGDDMLAFERALVQGRLLERRECERVMSTSIVSGTANAYGLEVASAGTESSVGHSGGAPGVSAQAEMFPNSRRYVVVLADSDPPAAARIAGKIRLLLSVRPTRSSAN